jgi:hypothetical protein
VAILVTRRLIYERPITSGRQRVYRRTPSGPYVVSQRVLMQMKPFGSECEAGGRPGGSMRTVFSPMQREIHKQSRARRSVQK